MVFFAHAKINLGLRITERRSDGYHNIETLFYPVGLCDILEIVCSEDSHDSLVVTGKSTGCAMEDNLVYRAVKMLRERYDFPFLRIHLHKLIPSGAGLGGGSSDAACTLKAVSKSFRLHAVSSELKAMALALGSDCPFFIDASPSFAAGRGEILSPAPKVLSGYHILIANPGVGINTGEAYRHCKPAKTETSLAELIARPVSEWPGLVKNDFEEYAFDRYPVISEIKEALYSAGAVFSLMSGSGSSVFGIFAAEPSPAGIISDYMICKGLIQ